MVITILEANVTPEKGPALEQAYQAGLGRLDPGIVETFLLHSFKDSTLWRILTVWESRQALDQMRNSGETPRGVLMFRAAEAEPTLSVFDVVSHAAAAT